MDYTATDNTKFGLQGLMFTPQLDIPQNQQLPNSYDIFAVLAQPEFDGADVWFRNLLTETGLDYTGIPIVIDYNADPGTVGCFYPGLGIMGVNPMYLLMCSDGELIDMLRHEGTHAGLLTKETIVLEESVTQTMTVMMQDWWRDHLATGYDPLVDQLWPYIQHLSLPQMAEMIVAQEDGNADSELTLANFLEMIVIRPALLNNGLVGLSGNYIAQSLRSKWPMLLQLFPRMINDIEGSGKGLHVEATMSFANYDASELLRRSADIIINKNWLDECLSNVFGNDMPTSIPELVFLLDQAGFGHLYEYYPNQVLAWVTINTLNEISAANNENSDSQVIEWEELAPLDNRNFESETSTPPWYVVDPNIES